MNDLQNEYDNAARVADSARMIANYADDAAMFREHWQWSTRDLPYGPSARNDVDIFWASEASADADLPSAVFVHGGYWQRFDRRMFSHMASGLLANGVNVAVPSYTLAPEGSVADICNDIRRLLVFLHKSYAWNPFLIGHSAGAHLVATALTTDWKALGFDPGPTFARVGFGFSGVYDLCPLVETTFNDALGLTKDEARVVSPLFSLPDPNVRFDVAVGSDESAEFKRQSIELARRWRMYGATSNTHFRDGRNHFDIVEDLTDPGSDLVRLLVEQMSEYGRAGSERE